MNVAVLGTGFGTYHAKLLKSVDLCGRLIVFGRNDAKLAQLEKELNVEIARDIGGILRDPDIDVIDLCLPTSLHCEVAVKALEHGKHVFCETPVCCSVEEAAAMLDAERSSGKRVLVNRFIHFDPAYAFLRESCLKGTYGKLLSLTLKRETPPLWGDLGLDTIPVNLMIHELDIIGGIMDSPELISAWGTEYRDARQSLVRAVFGRDGAIAEIVSSSGMPDGYPFTVGYEAYFESGKLVFLEKDSGNQSDAALTEYTASGARRLVLKEINPYAATLEHALQSLHHGTNSLLSLENAAESLANALGIRRQIKQK
ncbi:Predicted dehydrogenase [Paenibacillus sophorae]|uniref:Gfo/Idh/MocA family oxidoreductase n=1 Tax=Paenibacillus sophorae TaxID=1333845 RepID=A0A1H8FRT0_9BACL|nr:Gfo/Idh/MocA family oxidoreductase [Paenibacillus sophorae]QWU13958.1 Gfo/Idh/MocA family oxidoreductase [Paenibacillus sophorae]SEN34402.1 Predicted dehydrogenase [Paenibacillus sophorae]